MCQDHKLFPNHFHHQYTAADIPFPIWISTRPHESERELFRISSESENFAEALLLSRMWQFVDRNQSNKFDAGMAWFEQTTVRSQQPNNHQTITALHNLPNFYNFQCGDTFQLKSEYNSSIEHILIKIMLQKLLPSSHFSKISIQTAVQQNENFPTLNHQMS